MVEFFIPAADDPAEAERVFAAVREFTENQMGATLDERRFYRINYYHDRNHYVATVGEVHQLEGETVVCILLDTTRRLYYVCTENRGVARNQPILVGAHATNSIQEFD